MDKPKKSRFKVTNVSQQEESRLSQNGENLLKVISCVKDAKDCYDTWDENQIKMENSTTWNEGIRSVNWKKLHASNIHKSSSWSRLSNLFRRRPSKQVCKFCGLMHVSGSCRSGSIGLLTDADIPPLQLFPYFLQSHSIYDLMPINCKVVVISVDLDIIHAITAILDNSIRSLFLYDTVTDALTGILTLTDLLSFYRKFVQDDLYDFSLFGKTTIRLCTTQQQLLRISPELTLFEGVARLRNSSCHRLPVMTRQNNILYVFTYKRVLRFLYYSTVGKSVPGYMYSPMQLIGVGIFKGVVKVEANSPLTHVLDVLETTKISAVPLVDDKGHLIGQLSKLDILLLSMRISVFFPSHITAMRALDIVKKVEPRRLITCKRSDTFINVWEKMLQLQASRAFFVDEQRKLIGVVSVSDIVNYLTFGSPIY